MAAEERNGVRTGMRVRDLDGKDLGRVRRLYEWGFEIQKGLPLVFRSDFVATYDEVRGIEGGVLTIARTDGALLDLAAGGVPPGWRVPAPHGFPDAATPGEARGLYSDLAGAAVTPGPPEPPGADVPLVPEAESGAPVSAGDERDYERTRGQAAPGPAAHP